MKTCTHEGDRHQNQTPSLPFTGSKNAEHREQQAADLHHVHDDGRSDGHQLGRETTGKSPLMGGRIAASAATEEVRSQGSATE